MQRFKDSVDTSGECHVWIKKKSKSGYGNFYYKKFYLAHRFSWSIRNGEIPNGLCVLHRCDNPSCVNPDHLFLGTHKDNYLDMVAKGRSNPQKGDMHWAKRHPELIPRGEKAGQIKHPEKRPRGEKHGGAKLTQLQIGEIRRICKTRDDGEFSQKEIAKKYNVSRATICLIMKNKIWTDIDLTGT